MFFHCLLVFFVFSLRVVASSGATYEWEGTIMSKSEVSAPVSSAASPRLSLGVSWVRPGAGSIDSAPSPSQTLMCYSCFAGNEE